MQELKMMLKTQTFITGNQIARIGILENPKSFGSDQLLTLDKASAAYGLRLSGTGYSSVTFTRR